MKKVLLLILDGWGLGKKDHSDAIHLAKTPYMDSLYKNYPNAVLKTFGENVGLPQGQMGNSEVGHMNIGAGRIVWQMLVRINKAFQNNTVREMEMFNKMVDLAKDNPKRKIHLMGLVSDGGVHSSIDHLQSILGLLKSEGLDNRVFIHAFTDGRDTDPKGGLAYLQQIEDAPERGKAKIASIVGRYFAMDRDKRWERTAKAYRLLVHAQGDKYESVKDALTSSYENGITDEFVEPIVLAGGGKIEADDIVLSFNFRTDRCRQITQALTQEDFLAFDMKKLAVHYFTMTEYDKSFTGVNVLFDNHDLTNTLGEVLSNQNKHQLRAAETEKYPHVTFFFNGGREEAFVNEDRFMVNSPKVATYDLQPEMSAPELADGIVERLNSNKYDFLCVNFANPDMVGHTGVVDAIIKACETVDSCSERVVTAALENEYSVIVIADHGNADKVMNNDGSPNTAHTTNLVPCILIDKDVKEIHNGKLADIAPSVLKLMKLSIPEEMDGQPLF